jgi:hypothetical protein
MLNEGRIGIAAQVIKSYLKFIYYLYIYRWLVFAKVHLIKQYPIPKNVNNLVSVYLIFKYDEMSRVLSGAL